jgi:hypothetical protein
VKTQLRKQAYLGQSAIIPDVTMEWVTVSNVSKLAILNILFDRVKRLVPGDLYSRHHSCLFRATETPMKTQTHRVILPWSILRVTVAAGVKPSTEFNDLLQTCYSSNVGFLQPCSTCFAVDRHTEEHHGTQR